MIDSKDHPKDGVSIENKTSANFKVFAVCDPKKTNPDFVTDEKQLSLTILSDGNCGTYLPIAEFMKKNKWIVSLCLIVFGVVLLFFGGSKWDILLTIVGFLVGAGGILILLFGFVEIK